MNRAVFICLMLAVTQGFLSFFFIATEGSGIPSAIVAAIAGMMAPVYWEDK